LRLLAGVAFIGLASLALWVPRAHGAASPPPPPPTAKEQLGRRIFLDKGLSEPAGQSCASCHDPARAFSDPIANSPTSRGANRQFFGPRNSPSAMYGAFNPVFQTGSEGGDGGFSYLGGFFRDGRVNTLEEQAKKPLLNPIEMGNTSVPALVAKLRAAPYAADFEATYGAGIFDQPEAAFTALADAIATFERSKAFAPFSSRYDAWQAGKGTLSDAEMRGMLVFNAPEKGRCASCHMSASDRPDGRKSLFTDYGFDNIGVPRNPENRFYRMPPEHNPEGKKFVDIGLGAVVLRPTARGLFKAPTLRNIAVTGPYMHNGYFKTLRGLVDFYNTRDVKPTCASRFTLEAEALRLGCWPEAEVKDTVNRADMGNLGLSEQEVDDLTAFLDTLTDSGFAPPPQAKR
jgi:cytochrome c peroxidase